MTSTLLPRDILLSIIDIYNNNGDIEMLKTWSLVNFDFFSICRPHIYRTFDMRSYLSHEINKSDRQLVAASQKIFTNFHRFIVSNQHLAPFIRVVHVTQPGSSDYMRYLLHSLICEQAAFSEVVRLLPNLQCFGLHFPEHISWTSFSRRVEQTLSELCGRDNLKVLHLSGIRRFPVGLLNRCTDSLEELHLNKVMIAESSPAPSLVGRAHASMHNSEVDDEEGLHSSSDFKPLYLVKASLISTQLSMFTSSHPVLRINLSRLTDLTISFAYNTLNEAWRIISLCKETLQRLSISQSDHAEGERLFSPTTFLDTRLVEPRQKSITISSTCATLGHLTSLEHLTLHIVIPMVKTRDAMAIMVEEWCALLETVQPDSAIRTVTITLDIEWMRPSKLSIFCSPFPINSDLDTTEGIDSNGKGKEKELAQRNVLTCLDDTLAGRGTFPRLSAVRMFILVAREHTVPRGVGTPTAELEHRHNSSEVSEANAGIDVYNLDQNSSGSVLRDILMDSHNMDQNSSGSVLRDILMDSHNMDQNSSGSVLRDILMDSQDVPSSIARPNLHWYKQRKRARARPFTFEEIEASVKGMMGQTKTRLEEGNAGVFEVVVRVDN